MAGPLARAARLWFDCERRGPSQGRPATSPKLALASVLEANWRCRVSAWI